MGVVIIDRGTNCVSLVDFEKPFANVVRTDLISAIFSESLSYITNELCTEYQSLLSSLSSHKGMGFVFWKYRSTRFTDKTAAQK